jgi:hypothetical protein
MIKLLLLSSLVHATVYGTDDRRPIPRTSPQQQQLARGVAILIPSNFKTVRADGLVDIETEAIGKMWNMCSSENFDYRRPGFFVGCTGFLIAPDLMVTAGHCMVNSGEERDIVTPYCEAFQFLFDFQEAANGSVQTRGLSPDRFVECEKVIHAIHDSVSNDRLGTIDFRSDFALVKLKRAIVNRPYFTLAKTPVKPGEQISMIGAALGGPLLHATGRVLSLASNYYSTNLDAFEGNSGSPVFNSNSEVIGLLVRGYPDSLISRPGASCSVVNHCHENATNCEQPNPFVPSGEHVFPLTRQLLGLE